MLDRNAVGLIIAKNRFTENALLCCSRDRPRINFLIFSDQECFVVAGSRVARGKTFPGAGNYYRAENIVIVSFEAFALRHPSCFRKNRRSGAQRGASENNFGQRFSLSTPCFMSYARDSKPSPHFSPWLKPWVIFCLEIDHCAVCHTLN